MKNQNEITSFWLAADFVSALINSIVWMIVSPSEIEIISQQNLRSPDNRPILLIIFLHPFQECN